MPTHECVSCGKCCDRDGWVVFPAQRFRALAISRGVMLDDLAARFGFVFNPLAETFSRYGRCPFFVLSRCTVYEFRPDYCRAWPHIAGEDWIENAQRRGCQGVQDDE